MNIKKILKEAFEAHKLKRFNKILIQEGLDYNITPIKYFREDGKNYLPGGIYSARAYIENRMRANTKSFKSILKEALNDEQYGVRKYKGGIIVFSYDVNSVIDQKKNIIKIQKFLEKKYYTWKNRLTKSSKVYKIINDWNKDFNENSEFFIHGASFGNSFYGKYIDALGNVYNEKSMTLELIGVPSELLLLIATDICREFLQDSVIVKDFNKDKIYYVDSNNLGGKNIQKKLIMQKKI